MSEMKPVAWMYRQKSENATFTTLITETRQPMVGNMAKCEEVALYDTTAFRALVEKVCDPTFEGCSEFTLKLEERARIRAALLAALGD